jgi:hypothetical protein
VTKSHSNRALVVPIKPEEGGLDCMGSGKDDFKKDHKVEG